MDEKQLSNNIPTLDSELNGIVTRLSTLRADLNTGIYGCYDTSEKDEEKPKLEPSLRTIADKVVDIQCLLSSIETLSQKIRSTNPVASVN